MYGGAAEGGFSDSLHCLHLETFQWQLIECTNGPTEKRLGGMVSFGSNLFTFGGAGTGVQFSTEHGAKFIPNKSFNQWDDEGWNNALHKYNIVKGELKLWHTAEYCVITLTKTSLEELPPE